MAEMRKQFTFYEHYWLAVKDLDIKQRLFAIEAIIEYSLYGKTGITEPPVPARLAKAHEAFMRVKPLMDMERRKAEEGRRSEEYKKWRKDVFERDDYRCQCCGEKGGQLNAHHIKPYAYYPELRVELSNGVTLCIKCHKAAHKKRGVKQWRG